MNEREEQFSLEVDEAINTYQQLIGTYAIRTIEMINRYGKTKTLSRLVVSAELQQGFKTLWQHNKLDKTVEAIVVRYKELFAPDVVTAAQWRLDNADSLQ